VLNADDPRLVAAARDLTAPIAWFSLDEGNSTVTRHVARGGRAAVLRGGGLTLLERGRPIGMVNVSEMPMAIGGAARHNIANALAAVLAAGGLGLPLEAVSETLRRFGTDPADNPGRANLFEVGGVKVLVDYAHNPHGMEALAAAAAGVHSRRRLVMLGQAGDRSEQDIRALARSVMALRPDRVVAKEMDRYLRGRAPGEIPGILADEFRRQGLTDDRISTGELEVQGVEQALEWARPGDLLILAIHQDRPLVAALLDRLRAAGWRAGEPLPR
jgi:UDP-N-acetylmuramyl tripeptide synthase